jgi:hypothetical protein
MVSVSVIRKEHIRRVVNRTSTLAAAAKVLGISNSTLFRLRWKHKMGPPERTPPESLDDSENFTND